MRLKESVRACIICRRYFDSGSPSERFCKSCRKKRQGRENMAYMPEIPMTHGIRSHLDKVERSILSTRPDKDRESSPDILQMDDSFDDIDDNAIYDQLMEEEEDRLFKTNRKKRTKYEHKNPKRAG